jgi:hypothetical protein
MKGIMKRLLLIMLLCSLAFAQGIGGKAGVGGSTGFGTGIVPGPFNLYVEDFSGITNGNAPTNTTLCVSFYPGAACPSGSSFTVTNGASVITADNTELYTWPAFTLTGGSWPNSSTVSGKLAMGTINNQVKFNYPTAVQAAVSECTPVYTNWPQTTTSTSRMDYNSLLQSSAMFNTFQFSDAGTSIVLNTECGGTLTGGNCSGGEGINGTMPTGTWQILCHVTNNTTGASYSAAWNAPTSGSPFSTGTLVANSLVTALSSTTGGTSTASILFGTNNGSGAGPSGFNIWAGTTILCGLSSGQTSCGFPAAPFLQLLNPTDSPGSGNYSSGQTVTVSSPSANTDTFCYTTCTTTGCTPTAPTASNGSCTSGTTYSSSFTATPPEAVSYIATRNGNQNSSVFTSDYVPPNATYAGAAFATGSGSTTLAVSGLSIPSGDIIVCGNGNSSNGNTGCTDSHSDTFSCSSVIADAGNGYVELCGALAGASVTSVTCSQTFSSHTINCSVAWYSKGTLAGTVDQTAGADNASGATWNTGNTATLAGSSDLVVGFWQSCCSVTSTPTDGSTQRSSSACTGTYQCALQDRTGWGTNGTFASGNWGSASGATAVIAIK